MDTFETNLLEKVTKAFSLPANLVGSDQYTLYCADRAASFSQSDAPLSMNETINPPAVESSVTPAAPEPASLTPAEQRKAELEARRAAVKAEAKALVAEERALAKAARDLARAKAKALIEIQKQQLKDTTKMLLEITKRINSMSAYGLETLEISFCVYDNYSEITDIGCSNRGSEMRSIIDIIEASFPSYWNHAPNNYLFKQKNISSFDLFLELVANHVDAYIPAGTKTNSGLVVIRPREPIKDRVLVYLKDQELQPLFTAETEEPTATAIT